jgi:hypothetical protein
MSFLSEYSLSKVPGLSVASQPPQLQSALDKAGISGITCFDFSEDLRCWILGTSTGQAVFLRHDQQEAQIFKEPDSGSAVCVETLGEFAVFGFTQGNLLVWDLKNLCVVSL